MMARMVVTMDTLQQLLQQARMSGNAELVAQLEQAIRDAKPVKNPNAIDDWDDAREAFQAGNLTIKKESVREAARVLFAIADHTPQYREKVLQLFSRAMRNGES
jgi:acyl-CoA reductase-like NAD-dependent aldehyde dehydrogenase